MRCIIIFSEVHAGAPIKIVGRWNFFGPNFEIGEGWMLWTRCRPLNWGHAMVGAPLYEHYITVFQLIKLIPLNQAVDGSVYGEPSQHNVSTWSHAFIYCLLTRKHFFFRDIFFSYRSGALYLKWIFFLCGCSTNWWIILCFHKDMNIILFQSCLFIPIECTIKLKSLEKTLYLYVSHIVCSEIPISQCII